MNAEDPSGFPGFKSIDWVFTMSSSEPSHRSLKITAHKTVFLRNRSGKLDSPLPSHSSGDNTGKTTGSLNLNSFTWMVTPFFFVRNPATLNKRILKIYLSRQACSFIVCKFLT